MKSMVLFEGAYEIIQNPEYKPSAEKMYTDIIEFFSMRGYDTKRIPTLLCRPLTELLPTELSYVAAHSLGTNRFVENYKPEEWKELKAIFLFDPSEQLAKTVNQFRTPTLTFISSLRGRPYSMGFQKAIYVPDDHFFTTTLNAIKKQMEKVVIRYYTE
jgi:hypothetical protein